MNPYVERDAFARDLRAGSAPADVILRKQFVCESISKAPNTPDSSRQRTFVISTSAVDRDNDVIAVSGWNLDNYKKNPVVLWAHDASELPIAKAVSVGVNHGKLVATAEFADHQRANDVLRLIDGGFLRATSVGFRPTKSAYNQSRQGIDFAEQELLEFSIVPIPANPEALVVVRAFGLMDDHGHSPAEDIVAEIDDAKDEEVEFSPRDFTDALAETVKEALNEVPTLVERETSQSLARAFGRVDDEVVYLVDDPPADPAARYRSSRTPPLLDVDLDLVVRVVAEYGPSLCREALAEAGEVAFETTRAQINRRLGRVD